MKRLVKFIKMVIGIIASIVGMLVLVGVIFLYTSPEFGSPPSGSAIKKFEASTHFTDGKFENLTETSLQGEMNYTKTLSGFFTVGNKAPKNPLPIQKLSKESIAQLPDSITRVTWFGHSAIFLEMDGKKIFIDPMLGSVPAPHPLLGSKRFNDTLPLAIEDIPYLDAVLISHDHYDHLDYKSIKQLKEKVGHFYVPLGVDSHLISWGVSAEKITALDWWEKAQIDEINLIATPARHFSGRGITDQMKTQWCSWVIKNKTQSIYFSGDSGYEAHFADIGNKFGPFDLAILECGQYDTQWPLVHMMPEETVQAAIDLKAEVSLPIHWGAFRLALHDWDDPIMRVTQEAALKNATLATPIIGMPIILGAEIPNGTWWK